MSCDRSTSYPLYAASNEDVILQQVRGNDTIDNANGAQMPQAKRPRVDSGGAAQGQIGQLAGLGLQEHQQQHQQQQSQSNEVRWLLMAARASSVGQASWSALQGGGAFLILGWEKAPPHPWGFSRMSMARRPHRETRPSAPWFYSVYYSSNIAAGCCLHLLIIPRMIRHKFTVVMYSREGKIFPNPRIRSL